MQLPPAETLLPQLLLCRNWAAFVPPSAMPEKDSAEEPELLSVTLRHEDAVLTVCDPKLTLLAESVAVGPVELAPAVYSMDETREVLPAKIEIGR